MRNFCCFCNQCSLFNCCRQGPSCCSCCCPSIGYMYGGNQPGITTYRVIYNPNGGTGGSVDRVQPGRLYTIKSAGEANLADPFNVFVGWNTKPDGSGTAYLPGDPLYIQGNMVLFAQWRQEPENTYQIIFHSNVPGAQYTYTAGPIPVGTSLTLPSGPALGFSYPGWDFVYWNTMPDGSGTSYYAEETVTLDIDTQLYGIWRRPV